MARIIVKLKPNRDVIGKLELYDRDGRLIASYPAFGRADIGKATSKGNPGASSIKPYGHTPTGRYTSNNSIISSGQGTNYNPDSYGPNGIIFLRPSTGNALKAKANGRTGLAIHGGKIGTANKLRPTNGCVRLKNENMAELINHLRFFFMQGDTIEFIEVKEEEIVDNVTGDLLAQSNDPDPFVVS